MEQVRLLAAIGLSFLVLFLWSVFFTQNPEPSLDDLANHAIEKKSGTRFQKKIMNLEKMNDPSETSKKMTIPKDITVSSPLFQIIFSEKGASIKSVKLKLFRENMELSSDLKELIPKKLFSGNFSIYFSGDNPTKIENSIFTSNIEGNYLEVFEHDTKLSFTLIDDTGRTIVKTFSFNPNSYLIGVKTDVKNTSENIIRDNLIFSLKGKNQEKPGYTFEGPSIFIDGKLKQIKTKNIEKDKIHKGRVDWTAIEDRYFISSIIPISDFAEHVELEVENKTINSKLIGKAFQLDPNHQITFNSLLFMGPKSTEVLNNVGHNMEKAIYFGIFNFIAKPCLWFMNKIHGIIPNYGIAIIILTVFTKILLWPLGSKGYRSMSEMKKLQPFISEIRKKHGKDKQKMNKEIVALYKTYRVNPVGGCLPMFLQIPVFFALYKMLYQAIELRHAPFILWINDLSAPDRLFHFDFSVPFMQPPYGIPVLTIIMGATMLLQQKMSPPPGDPIQAKIMMLMPIIFTFIFVNFSSGLVLYWLTNNILSMGQQYYVQKKTT